MKIDLAIPPDDLSACVACGLCLPHCPTYRVTSEESASPRGRIALMRQVTATGEASEAFVDYMDACVQCLGCETACPAGVKFGSMMTSTRVALAEQAATVPRLQRWAFRLLDTPRTLNSMSRALAVVQRFRLVPKRVGLARLPVLQRRLRSSGDDVWLHTGCVMDAWLRSTHASVQSVLEAMGLGVAVPGPEGACCGALTLHAGLDASARRSARATMRAFPGSAPILVDSAGCGAAMKEYGHLLGTDEAAAFAERVYDVHEWLADRVDELPEPRARLDTPVAVQDPCHLRHGQGVHLAVREVLGRYADLVELDDEGLCCGAGGAYSVTHPLEANAIRDRKLEAIARTGATVVASANPGCLMHLRSAGLDVRHPMDIVAAAISPPGR
jgi:glycolate oxidase iron-sulfur subunit